MIATWLFTADVFGVLLRVLECEGRRWLCSEDIARVCEYRSCTTVTSIARRNKHAIEGHSVKARIDGEGQAFRIFDEDALRYFCKYSPRPGALHLLRWLDTGGLQANCDTKIPFDNEQITDKCVVAETFEQPEAVHKNVVDLKGENAITLFSAEVFGVILRVLVCDGKRWLCAHDIAKTLEYVSSDSVRYVWQRHKDSLQDHSIKARISGEGQAVRLFDEVGLRYFCEYSKRPGAFHLLRWLDAGGLQAACDDMIPFDEGGTSGKPANVGAFDVPTKKENVLAFKRPNQESYRKFNSKDERTSTLKISAGNLPKEQLYCSDLLSLLFEHCERPDAKDIVADLVADIRTALDELIDGVLRDHYSPELNANRYELFSCYWVLGGDV